MMTVVTAEKFDDREARTDFDRWAAVYDEQPNPLIALEERVMAPLLPPLRGHDVLDAGCGTGRWLERIAQLEPKSLVGVDLSTSMLEMARAKLGAKAHLHLGSCTDLTVQDLSVDVLLCSFVLSYVDDMAGFVKECERVIRAGGKVLISDMHPVTAAERKWKRSFQWKGENLELAAYVWHIPSIMKEFELHGFKLIQRYEPCFGRAEYPLFDAAGKLDEVLSLKDVPAIYVLAMQKMTGAVVSTGSPINLKLSDTKYAINSDSTQMASIGIAHGQIAAIGEDLPSTQSTIDLTGYLLLPGLINAHDHLEFALYPRLGRTFDAAPYSNAKEWAKEIHRDHSVQIELHRRIPLATRLWWGAIRNLVCGVTTVCHHNPLHPDLMESGFPVRVVSRFGWAHSLAFDRDVIEKFNQVSEESPFIIHAGEGVDTESMAEISRLNDLGALDARTIVVHGLALQAETAALINNRGASLVVCPTSNDFLFHRTLNKQQIESIGNVAIGSDSPLTAAGDLLDEVEYVYTRLCVEKNKIHEMITTGPAQMLRLADGEGAIQLGSIADIIAVRDNGSSPAEKVVGLTFDDVELVLLAGRVQMASPSLYQLLPDVEREGMELLEVEGCERWIRAPLAKLFASVQEVLGQNDLMVGGKRMRYVNPV